METIHIKESGRMTKEMDKDLSDISALNEHNISDVITLSICMPYCDRSLKGPFSLNLTIG